MSDYPTGEDIATQIALWHQYALDNHHKSTRFKKDYWEGYLDAMAKCGQIARGEITIHPAEDPK